MIEKIFANSVMYHSLPKNNKGHGLKGYLEAIDWFIGLISEGEHDDYKN